MGLSNNKNDYFDQKGNADKLIKSVDKKYNKKPDYSEFSNYYKKDKKYIEQKTVEKEKKDIKTFKNGENREKRKYKKSIEEELNEKKKPLIVKILLCIFDITAAFLILISSVSIALRFFYSRPITKTQITTEIAEEVEEEKLLKNISTDVSNESSLEQKLIKLDFLNPEEDFKNYYEPTISIVYNELEPGFYDNRANLIKSWSDSGVNLSKLNSVYDFLKENKKVTQVVLPEGITTINSFAFAKCTLIDTIILPDSLIEIQPYAFYGCENINFITIPKNVTIVGESAYEGCSSLETIYISHTTFNLERIEKKAFKDCQNLKDVEIPDGTKYIGDFAFENCTSLKSIYIPNSIIDVGVGIFKNCSNLYNIMMNDNDYLYGKKNNAIIRRKGYKGEPTLVAGCQDTIISDEIKSIDDYALYGCIKGNFFEINDNIKRIGDCAFENCTELKDLILPNNLEEIGYNSFAGVKHVTNNSVNTNVRNDLMNNFCETVIDGYVEENFVYKDYTKKEVIRYIGNSDVCTIPDGVEIIGEYFGAGAYAFNIPTTIVIPHTVKEIKTNAFLNGTNIIKISIPNSVEVIGENAFDNCNISEALYIPINTKFDESNFGHIENVQYLDF